MQACDFCKKDTYKHLRLKENTYWRVELRMQQSYLGWCFIILKRHLEDLIDISAEEREELFSITKDVKKALTEAFQPDKFNYASLGNISSHVHLQVIPRYKEPRQAFGREFTDKFWGQHMLKKDSSFILSDDILMHITNQLKDLLKK